MLQKKYGMVAARNNAECSNKKCGVQQEKIRNAAKNTTKCSKK